jgi:hypothetical protein
VHYQYRFNEFFDALSGVLDLVNGACQRAHPFLGIVVSSLLELYPGSCFVLDLLDHLAVLANYNTDSRSRHCHLKQG